MSRSNLAWTFCGNAMRDSTMCLQCKFKGKSHRVQCQTYRWESRQAGGATQGCRRCNSRVSWGRWRSLSGRETSGEAGRVGAAVPYVENLVLKLLGALFRPPSPEPSSGTERGVRPESEEVVDRRRSHWAHESATPSNGEHPRMKCTQKHGRIRNIKTSAPLPSSRCRDPSWSCDVPQPSKSPLVI